VTSAVGVDATRVYRIRCNPGSNHSGSKISRCRVLTAGLIKCTFGSLFPVTSPLTPCSNAPTEFPRSSFRYVPKSQTVPSVKEMRLTLLQISAFLLVLSLYAGEQIQADSRPVVLRAPSVFGLVSEDFSRFVDREQGFVWPERALVRNTRENLF
jgi:hypothetical protein